MPGESPSGGGEDGIALLLVVWLLALLAVITVAITADARTGLRIARNQVDAAQVQALADGGIWWATTRMADPDRAAHLRPDGTPYQVALGGQNIAVTVQDERGKLDLNEAQVEAFAKLCEQVGVDPAVAQAIGSYRDRLRLPTLNPTPGRELAPAGKRVAFAAVEDLRLVEGVTPDAYLRLLPFVTVFTAEPRVNPLTAPVQVLLSVPGLDRSLVEEQLRRRQMAAAEVDDRDRLLTAQGSIAGLTWAEANLVTIRSVARMASGAAFVREAVVELEPGGDRPYKVLAWRHGLE